MNYEKIYNALIEKARIRELSEYSEMHHIVPRCIGGTDDKENLIKLTPEEHYVAHQLLTKIYPSNYSLVKAASMMIPNRPSNKMYGWLRRRFSKAKSIEQTGSGNSQYGTRWIHNVETKENRKIKSVLFLDDGWFFGRYKEPKVKQISNKDLRRQEDIKIYEKYYELYKQVGFIKFVEITGYDKSKPNLVQRFAKLLDHFEPQNGKKRNNSPVAQLVE